MLLLPLTVRLHPILVPRRGHCLRALHAQTSFHTADMHLVALLSSAALCVLLSASNTAYRALQLVDKGYRLDTYRAAADDPSRRIVPPIWADLTADPAHLPPQWVEGQSGRPKKGPRKKTRIPSLGQHHTSSRTFAIYNAGVRAAGGVGMPPHGEGATGGGGAGGSASGAGSTSIDLSQEASQNAS